MRGGRWVSIGASVALVVACTGGETTTTPPPADASIALPDASLPSCTTCDAGGEVDATTRDSSLPDTSTPDVADTSVDDVVDASMPDVVDASVDDVVDASVDDVVDASIVDAPGATDDASVAGEGCADGTREGLGDGNKYPDVGACAGAWTGDVATAGLLCAGGWHVCTGAEPAMKTVQYADATAFPGCFAIDAAQDNSICYPSCDAAVKAGIDSAANVDMGAVGGGCTWKFQGSGSCISGGRLDASENSGTGCDWYAGLTGVTCCRDSM